MIPDPTTPDPTTPDPTTPDPTTPDPISPAAAFTAFKLGTLIAEFRVQFRFQTLTTWEEFEFNSDTKVSGLKQRLDEILREWKNLVLNAPSCAKAAKSLDITMWHKDSLHLLDRLFKRKRRRPSDEREHTVKNDNDKSWGFPETGTTSEAWEKIIEGYSTLDEFGSELDAEKFKTAYERLVRYVEAKIPKFVTSMQEVFTDVDRTIKPFFDLGLHLTKLRWAFVTGDEPDERGDLHSDATSAVHFEEQMNSLRSLVRECNHFLPGANLAESPLIQATSRCGSVMGWHVFNSMTLEIISLRASVPSRFRALKFYSGEDYAVEPQFDELVTITQIRNLLEKLFSSEGTNKRLQNSWQKEWGDPDGTASGAVAWLWGRIKPTLKTQSQTKKKGRKPKSCDKLAPNPIPTDTDSPSDHA